MLRILLIVVSIVLQPRESVSLLIHPGASDDAWVWPVSDDRSVLQVFDPPEVAWASGHRGIDVAASVDAQVLAVEDGVVSFTGSIAGVGIVSVTHGDLRSTYQPLVPSVVEGQIVHAGDLIGTLLPGHCAAAVCLHLGVLRGEEYLDPESFFSRHVRLLPLDGLGKSAGYRP